MKFKYPGIANFNKNIDFGKIAILSQKSGIFKQLDKISHPLPQQL